MGWHFNADVAWGIVVADHEEEAPDPYSDWDLPEFLDYDYFGDASAGWTGLVLFLKGTQKGAMEGGCEKLDLDAALTTVEEFSESDEFEQAVAWCDDHGLDWAEASWLVWASGG